MRHVLVAALLAALTLWCTGCQRKSEASPSASLETTKAPAAAPADPTAVDLEPAMVANVKVEPVRQQSLPRVLTATGKVQFNEELTARILAPLPGQVFDLNAHTGDAVAKDQVLFSVKSREVTAMVTEYLQGQRDQELAEKTLRMTRDLYEHQAASRMSLQQAEADVNKTKAQVARAEEALRVVGLDPKAVAASGGVRSLAPVRSPISGTVMERNVTAGQFVQADATPLITIADLSTVWVLVDVFEADVHLVRPGARVNVTATAYPDRHFTARVERIADRVDPETRALKVRLLVSNPGTLLKPEMFITASLVVGEAAPAITIPSEASFTEGDRSYAFVAVSGQRFERRSIAAAPDGPGRLRVASGLQPGDRIVADGALLLRLRQKQQQQPE